jgi:hypothetical protein
MNIKKIIKVAPSCLKFNFFNVITTLWLIVKVKILKSRWKNDFNW